MKRYDNLVAGECLNCYWAGKCMDSDRGVQCNLFYDLDDYKEACTEIAERIAELNRRKWNEGRDVQKEEP